MQRSAFSSKAGSNGTGKQPSGNVCNANAASSHCLQCLGHWLCCLCSLLKIIIIIITIQICLNLLESGTGRRPAQALYKDVIMPNNSKRSRSFSRAGWRPCPFLQVNCHKETFGKWDDHSTMGTLRHGQNTMARPIAQWHRQRPQIYPELYARRQFFVHDIWLAYSRRQSCSGRTGSSALSMWEDPILFAGSKIFSTGVDNFSYTLWKYCIGIGVRKSLMYIDIKLCANEPRPGTRLFRWAWGYELAIARLSESVVFKQELTINFNLNQQRFSCHQILPVIVC